MHLHKIRRRLPLQTAPFLGSDRLLLQDVNQQGDHNENDSQNLGQLGELARASYNNDENIVEMVEKIVPTFSPVGDKPTGNEKYGRNAVAVSAAK